MSKPVDDEVLARQKPVVTIAITVILALAFLAGIGIFAYATQERQNRAEHAASVAVNRSVTAATKAAVLTAKTTGIAEEERRVGALAIQNCERLKTYLAAVGEVRAESAANATNFSRNSDAIASEFARRRGWEDVAQTYRNRSQLDLQRAHIGRLGRKALGSLVSVACTLDLPMGR